MSLFEKTALELEKEFLGVVEFDDSKIVGWLEDADSDVDAGTITLRYPIEFIEKLHVDEKTKEEKYFVCYIRPELGLPDKCVLESECITIHKVQSTFGRTYMQALKGFKDTRLKLEVIPISRSQARLARQNNKQPAQLAAAQ